MKLKLTLLAMTTFLSVNMSFAQEVVNADPVVAGAALEANKIEDSVEVKAVRERLKTYFNNQDVVVSLAEAPLPNSYLLTLKDGTAIVYFKDTDYGVVGDLFNMKTRENLSAGSKSSYNKTVLKEFTKDEFITYPSTSKDKPVKDLYVFTDPTCGFCRKLHHELADYEAQGIAIHYLPFPRGGAGNNFAYNELIDIWCSTDRQKAIDLAKNDKGEEIKLLEGYKVTPSCKAIVDKGIELGAKLGISGTPSLFMENGYNIPGYVEPVRLRSEIEKNDN